MNYKRIIGVEGISKSFVNDAGVSIPILHNLSLNIIKDYSTTIIAPKGAGLSTFLSICADLLLPDTGKRVQLPGKKCFYVSKIPPGFSWLSNNEKFLFRKKQRDWVVRNLLTNVGLDGFEDLHLLSDSYSTQLRMVFAKCIYDKIDVLILDDSFSFLKDEDRFDIYDLLRQLKSEFNLTILLGTNNLTEAILLSDRIILMSKNPATFIQDIRVDFKHEKCFDLISTDEFREMRKFITEIYRNYDQHYVYRFTI